MTPERASVSDLFEPAELAQMEVADRWTVQRSFFTPGQIIAWSGDMPAWNDALSDAQNQMFKQLMHNYYIEQGKKGLIP